MKQKKTNNAANDLSIFVAFHILNDSLMKISEKSVKETMEKLFKNESKCLIKSENDNGFEMIYKIQQPLLVSDIDNEVFFNKLRKLFNLTSETFPHFTQVDEEELMSVNTYENTTNIDDVKEVSKK